jgi:hypothetical protein
MAYIKKEPIIEFIIKGLNNPDKTKAYGYDAIEILTEIEFTPTADVVEVKRGKWDHECLECSVCKRNISEICDADSYLTSGIEDELLFCPFCGAKMRGDTE